MAGAVARAATGDGGEAPDFFAFDVGGVFIEDSTYLHGISVTDNVAQQWQRRRMVLGTELEFGKRVSFEFEGGYGQTGTSFEWRDAYMRLDLPRRVEFRIGK